MMIFRRRKARHIRTGRIYNILHLAVTDYTDGKRYIVYRRMGKVFCCEETEFWCSFEEI